MKNPNNGSSKIKRTRPEYRSHTGPPDRTEMPVCTASPLCEGCPFPGHGFLCQGVDGECMRTRLMKLSKKEEPIHGAGDPKKIWTADHDSFLESMADAAGSVVDYFNGNLVYINVMKNMSVDCDCCAVAEDPFIADIGILASTDPIAIDQACIDLVYACSDPGKPHLLERIESRNGVHTIEAAAALGYGTRAYELIEVD